MGELCGWGLVEVFILYQPAFFLPLHILYRDHGKIRHSSLSLQETGVPKIQVVSSLSEDSDLELDDSSLLELDRTPIGSTGLSNIFAISKDPSKAVRLPFADICKPTATELETQCQVSSATSPRPLIQELEDEQGDESNQSLPPQTWASKAAPAQSSEAGDSQPPAATPLGNTPEAIVGRRTTDREANGGFCPVHR